MDRRRKIALACFAANAALGLAFGIVYLASPAAMPYHEAAMETSFSALGGGEQAVVLALMRVAGGGFVATALASAFLLARPFRAGERWAAGALLAVQLAMAAAAAYGVATVIVRTAASPPWAASLASLVLPVVGWLAAAPHPGIRRLLPRHAG